MFTRNVGYWSVLALLAGTLAGCGGADSNDNDPFAPAPGPGVTGSIFAITSANRLVSFNVNSPAVSAAMTVTGLQSNETIYGIDLRPGGAPAGQLYALGSSGRIYTIDTASGTATLKSTLTADASDATNPFTALDGTRFGVDTNTVPDRLRVTSDTGQNLRINVETGATITDGALTLAGAAVSGVTEVAYTNNFASACRTTLFYLDTAGDRLLSTSDPNNGTLTAVGNLGVDAAASSAFDIATAPDGSNNALTVLTVGNNTALYSISLTTGVTTAVGAITGLNAGETIVGMAAPLPATTPTQAPGELLALNETNTLVSFNSGSPQKLCTSAPVSGLQANETVLGMDLRPSDGNLYALGSAGRIYTLDPTSGSATFKAALSADAADATLPFMALDGTDFGVDVNPVPDRLRVVSDTGQDLRINMDTGATTTDTVLNPAGSSVTAAAYTNSFVGAATTTLYVLDAANGRLMIQGQPSGNPNNGDLQPVGPLGIAGDVQPVIAFDINGRSGTALATFTVGSATTSDLYSIDLVTGTATRINTIGGNQRVRGLTYSAAPQATLLGVTTDNRLIGFKLGTPQTLDSNIAITGMQGGEQILGFDSRPANGRLYALTDAPRLYVIDPASGVATLGATLVADATDATAPFSMLLGTSFGVDFNPVPDRMRVVSNAEQNLRINVDTGVTITDGTLNRAAAGGPAPDVTAAAYTRSFAGTTTTTLYDIDIATGILQRQMPPNEGVLVSVGALDPTLTFGFANGFDIAGGDDGLALAALQPSGASQSTLYRVNLATGAVTAIGAIGPTGTPVLSGLAIRLQ